MVNIKSLAVATALIFGSNVLQAETPPDNVLKTKLEPALYLDFDSGLKIINLTDNNLTKFNNDLYSTNFFDAAKDNIVFGDYRSGFLVNRARSFTGGIGVAKRWYYENPTDLIHKIWASVGIIPIKGHTYYSSRFIKNLEELDSNPERNIPMDPDAFSKWYAGDSVTFSSQGGLIFLGKLGIGPASATVAKISLGQYQIYIQKMDEQNILVKITKLHIDSLSAQVGVNIASIGASKYDEVADGMSYKVDISNELGKMAYHDLIRGNVAAIDKLILDGVNHVQKWDSFSSKQIGNFRNSFFGLPIVLNTKSSEGKIYELNQSNFYYEGTKTNATYGVYLKNKKTRVFNKHFERTQSFYGATYDVFTTKGELKTKGHFGQFHWSAETDASTRRRVRNAISDLVELTGLRDVLPVNLPDERKLGYADIDFSVTFTEEQTKKMIDNVTTLGILKISQGAALKAKAYFDKTDDVDGLCANATPPITGQATTCPEETVSTSARGGKEMVRQLSLMKQYWANDKEFVKAYAEFGKIISRNQFLFQTALELAGADVSMNYSIRGRDISNYQVNFSTSEKPGVLVKHYGSYHAPGSNGTHREDGIVILPSIPSIIAPIALN